VRAGRTGVRAWRKKILWISLQIPAVLEGQIVNTLKQTKNKMRSLSDKIAVVFAATGAIGGAVARSLAEQGAHVHVSGRNAGAAEALAFEITQAGGKAEAAQVDALDEAAIEAYLQALAARHGRLDIAFNAIGLRPSESGYGQPATELSFEDFLKPFHAHVGSQFLSARAAARHMMRLGSPGCILTLTASLSRLKLPFMAGITAACAAIEGLTRSLAAEFGPAGIRVICLNPTSLPETRTIRETNALSARSMGMDPEALAALLGQQYLLGRGPGLREIGEAAAFLASEAGAVFNSHVLDLDLGSRSVI
jgi:NAD(P)-dependent dehydrogenase (short-subunit alcohol dehydrogenase family)